MAYLLFLIYLTLTTHSSIHTRVRKNKHKCTNKYYLIMIYSKINPSKNQQHKEAVNPFILNASFLYPLKTSGNLTVFWIFQEEEKRSIGNEWVNWSAVQINCTLSIRHVTSLNRTTKIDPNINIIIIWMRENLNRRA